MITASHIYHACNSLHYPYRGIMIKIVRTLCIANFTAQAYIHCMYMIRM